MENTVSITFVDSDGSEHEVQGEVGKSLLAVAHENNINLEGMIDSCMCISHSRLQVA
jgi:ferredoxin